MYIEMSRDAQHGGGDWGFLKCIWSPTRKKNGTKWPFWQKIREAKAGEQVLHLRGKASQAEFIGTSTLSSDGFETLERPPIPGEWAFANSFFRAELKEFTPFPESISLEKIFRGKNISLEEYFYKNRLIRNSSRLNLFYVVQNKKLQCLNGAYLSDCDQVLFDIIFDEYLGRNFFYERPVSASTSTAETLRLVRARIGQDQFSENVRNNFGHRCCFPSCPVTADSFLVGAHIVRWADEHARRGNTDNGLCLCLMHDRAFEIGLFTLDEQLRVRINSGSTPERYSFSGEFFAQEGRKIRDYVIRPSEDALKIHRRRFHLRNN